MQIIVMTAIFVQEVDIFQIASLSILKILLQTMFLPSFMLVPSHRTILGQIQVAIHCKSIYPNVSFYSASDSFNIVTPKQFLSEVRLFRACIRLGQRILSYNH